MSLICRVLSCGFKILGVLGFLGRCARASRRGGALGAAAGVLDAGARARRGVGHSAHAGHVHLERGGDAARHVQQHHAGGVVRKQQLDALRAAALPESVSEGWWGW